MLNRSREKKHKKQGTTIKVLKIQKIQLANTNHRNNRTKDAGRETPTLYSLGTKKATLEQDLIGIEAHRENIKVKGIEALTTTTAREEARTIVGIEAQIDTTTTKGIEAHIDKKRETTREPIEIGKGIEAQATTTEKTTKGPTEVKGIEALATTEKTTKSPTEAKGIEALATTTSDIAETKGIEALPTTLEIKEIEAPQKNPVPAPEEQSATDQSPEIG